jgi:hypothetical protein
LARSLWRSLHRAVVASGAPRAFAQIELTWSPATFSAVTN